MRAATAPPSSGPSGASSPPACSLIGHGIRRGDRAALRRSLGRIEIGATLVLSAAPHPCGPLRRPPAGAGGRCRHAIHPSPARAEPGLARWRPSPGDRRCLPPRPRHRIRCVLDDYRRWRRFDALLLIAVTDSLNRLFSNDLAPLRLARDLGLAAVDRLPPVKRLLMRHAMGAAGPRPRLLRGLPL